MHFRLLASSFTLLLSGTWTWEMYPKILKWLTEGLNPLQASSGVLLLTISARLLFKICTVQFTASSQKFFEICFSDSMLRTIFMILWFFLSATLFYWGVYAAVNCLWMSFSSHKCVKFCDVNSPIQSVWRLFMNAPVSFSTLVLWDLKITIASDFSTKK